MARMTFTNKASGMSPSSSFSKILVLLIIGLAHSESYRRGSTLPFIGQRQSQLSYSIHSQTGSSWRLQVLAERIRGGASAEIEEGDVDEYEDDEVNSNRKGCRKQLMFF